MLEIKNITASYYKNNPILNDINLSVASGDIIGILGRNGSGKSTLAKTICGLVPYVQGIIEFEGNQINGLASHKIANMGIGLFFQGGRILPNLSVYENILFSSGTFNKMKFSERFKEISEWIELLNNKSRLNLKASYLSGGEKHQLALAMVIFKKPKLLILDEPSAGLSPINQTELYKILQHLKEQSSQTMIIIEQNTQFATDFCSKVLTVNNGSLFNRNQ